jgi:ActR/RegA family two-component response regulator
MSGFVSMATILEAIRGGHLAILALPSSTAHSILTLSGSASQKKAPTDCILPTFKGSKHMEAAKIILSHKKNCVIAHF